MRGRGNGGTQGWEVGLGDRGQSIIEGTGDTMWLGNGTEVTGAEVMGTLGTQQRWGEVGKIGGDTGMGRLGTGGGWG